MVSVSLTVAPLVTGVIHVMANPKLSYSTPGIVESGKRALPIPIHLTQQQQRDWLIDPVFFFFLAGIASLCRRFEPSFDQSKLCIKVPSTWEGLQACSKLKSLGIQTLATTLFTLEQAMLAAQVGCIYVSPFLHELKALLDETWALNLFFFWFFFSFQKTKTGSNFTGITIKTRFSILWSGRNDIMSSIRTRPR